MVAGGGISVDASVIVYAEMVMGVDARNLGVGWISVASRMMLVGDVVGDEAMAFL